MYSGVRSLYHKVHILFVHFLFYFCHVSFLATPGIVVLLLLIPLIDCTWPMAHSSLHCTSVSL